MIRSPYFNRATALLVAVSLTSAMGSALAPQISGGGSAFQGQDIMGGAAIVFKRPQRVRAADMHFDRGEVRIVLLDAHGGPPCGKNPQVRPRCCTAQPISIGAMEQ